jgi:hypothetical protein
VQTEAVRDVGAHPRAAHAVAVAIEAPRIHADAPLAGDDGEDASAHPALGGNADLVGPLAGEVVHAARVHDAEHVADVLALQGSLAGDRVDAGVGERRGHDRQVPAGDRDRALAQVQLEGGLDVAVEHPLAAHEVGGGPVAVGRLQLRLVGLLVDRKVVVAGVAALSVHHPLDALGDVRALDQVGRGERPGVDHRVVRPVVARIELERVERVATRLDPDAL